MTATRPPVAADARPADAAAAAPRREVASPPVVRGALAALLAATLAIAAAYASAFAPGGAPRWAAWAMALGVPLALVAVMALGAARGGRLAGRLLATFAFVGLLLAAGFALALALPNDLGAAEPLFLGLPRRAAIIVYGVGLLPTLVLPVAYALTFEAQTLRDEDLERVRAVGRVRRATDVTSDERRVTSSDASSAPPAAPLVTRHSSPAPANERSAR